MSIPTSRKSRRMKTFSYVALSIITVLVVFPIFWLIITSLKTYQEIYKYPITYYAHHVTWEHYIKIGGMHFWHYFLNSVIISSGTMLISLLIGLFPAFAFAQYNFKGRTPLLVSVMLFQMFPMVVFLVPIFKLLISAGLLNTRIGLILAYIPFTTPITIMFLRSFFVTIPKALSEAARIDGCSFMRSFWSIIIPVSLPGILSVGIYTFLFSWSELMYSMSILVDKNIQNIPTFLSVFVGEYQTRWGPLFAGSFLSMIPPVIVFLIFQKYFVKGLISGSVKG
jgi:multiple sugar transport system permease protein